MLTNEQTYNALFVPNQLTYGTGNVAVVTGWFPKERLTKHLRPADYAVVGNLYSPMGLNYLIRNLLANPQITALVIVCLTKEDANSGSLEALCHFHKHGVEEGISPAGKPAWIIKSRIPAYLDIEIGAGAIAQLREGLELHQCDSLEYAIEAIPCINRAATKPWGTTPLTFPIIKHEPKSLPGPLYGHRIEGKTIAETWVKLIHRIKTTGVIRPTGYDGHWQELIDLMAVITDEPEGFYFPEPNYLPCDRASVETYINSQVLKNERPSGEEGVKYTYGDRLHWYFGANQVQQVVDKLLKEFDSASGVMSLWDVVDHDRGGSPCLNHIWVRFANGELSLTATFRSNDMFSAWPTNAFGLRALQKHILNEYLLKAQLDFRGEVLLPFAVPLPNYDGPLLKLGPLVIISQSAHIYDTCWEYADKLIAKQYSKLNHPEYDDPVGNYLIQVVDVTDARCQIQVERVSHQGEAIATYSGVSAQKLLRQILADAPSILPSHAAYLGYELSRAETQWLNYEQDKGRAIA